MFEGLLKSEQVFTLRKASRSFHHNSTCAQLHLAQALILVKPMAVGFTSRAYISIEKRRDLKATL